MKKKSQALEGDEQRPRFETVQDFRAYILGGLAVSLGCRNYDEDVEQAAPKFSEELAVVRGVLSAVEALAYLEGDNAAIVGRLHNMTELITSTLRRTEHLHDAASTLERALEEAAPVETAGAR